MIFLDVIVIMFILVGGIQESISLNFSTLYPEYGTNNWIYNQTEKNNNLKNLNKINGYFTNNYGQIENHSVKFYIQDQGIWFLDDGIVFEILGSLENQTSEICGQDLNPLIKLNFENSNLVIPRGRELLPNRNNYFLGNDQTKWYTEVPNFKEIIYENIYDNIDVCYYFTSKGLKYDLIVHPGGDPNDIRLSYQGGKDLVIDPKGNIILQTKLWEIVDSELFIYQKNKTDKSRVDGEFKILAPMTYGFQLIGDYDKNEDLIIDPLIFSTFIGGINKDRGENIAIDSGGNLIITGSTQSSNFPNTTGANDTTYNEGTDVFVIKLNSNGTLPIYSTFIGGSSYDFGDGVAVDFNGNVYITGYTQSSDFPNTTNAFDNSYNGVQDIFILKLNPLGSKLIYSTFIGGSSHEYSYDIVTDSNGNAYVTGYTNSSDFPNTSGAYDRTYNGGDDVFICKLNSSGSNLTYSTFIGGSSYEMGYDITIDSEDNVYITGVTGSVDFPNTTGAFDESFNVVYDAFVLKLNETGSGVIYSTFIGGLGGDVGYGITIDINNQVYITGETKSTDFPITPNAYNSTIRGVFILSLNKNGSELLYSTFIGLGTGKSISIDINGNVYITGYTGSPKFPTTPNANDSSFNRRNDCFILKLDPKDSSLLYSTFIGGRWDDYGNDIVIDENGDIFITGITDSHDFPTTSGSFDTQYNSDGDAFALKLRINNFPSVQDLNISKSTVFRTDSIYLYANALDLEESENNLTSYFQYKHKNEQDWHDKYFSTPQYRNSEWEVSFTPLKNSKLGSFDFRVRFNDSELFFSNLLYLNDSLLVLNNLPMVENLSLSKNNAILGDELSIWVNSYDIEDPEMNLTIELEYKDPNNQLWNITYFDKPKYINDRWEIIFSIPFDAPFGYYDFKVRFNDTDGNYSTWLYANDSLKIHNQPPKIIDVKITKKDVYRTMSTFLYINGTDHETSESKLKLYAQFKHHSNDKWTNLKIEYSNLNNRWGAEFKTYKNSTLGLHDFRFRLIDNLNTSSEWQYLNKSLKILNNIPTILDIKFTTDSVFRTETIKIFTKGYDVETLNSLLKCNIQYKSSSDIWINIDDKLFNIDHWEINFTPPINAELGFYNFRINFTDEDNDHSDRVIINDAIKVKNNPPIISNLCDDFKSDNNSKDINLTPLGADIEQPSDELNWEVNQSSVNTELFTVEIIDHKRNILRIIPTENVNNSDDITLILSDDDRGIVTKTNVTIHVDSIFNYVYSVNLTVIPNIIKIYPGEFGNITLKITNFGNVFDNYSITFESDNYNLSDIKLEIKSVSLASNQSKSINVKIIVSKNMKSEDYTIIFRAKSIYSSDETSLTVKVIEKPKDKEKGENSYLSIAIGIVAIIVILTIILFIIFVYKKRNKKQEIKPEEKLNNEQSNEIKELQTIETQFSRENEPSMKYRTINDTSVPQQKESIQIETED